ncbi:MAG: radical SAM protein [candidate division WOR-3 bacterium]
MINIFDPWKGGLCTCKKKYTLNPYTGCMHHCLYCYITGYVKDGFNLRVKKINFKSFENKLKKLDKNLPFSISNSSDPYPKIEEKLKITRRILEILRENDFKVSIITKSPLFLRDVDILKDMKATISITITTPLNDIARKLEPDAPLPSERIYAIKEVSKYKIPLCIRIDPIIPGINDDYDLIDDFLKEISPYINMVSVSTYKAKPDNFKRLKEVFKNIKIDFDENKIRGYRYIKKEKRFEMLFKIKNIVKKYNLKFGICREGFFELKDTISCDPIFEYF